MIRRFFEFLTDALLDLWIDEVRHQFPYDHKQRKD